MSSQNKDSFPSSLPIRILSISFSVLNALDRALDTTPTEVMRADTLVLLLIIGETFIIELDISCSFLIVASFSVRESTFISCLLRVFKGNRCWIL